MITSTAERVPANTAPHVNAHIRRGIDASIAYYTEHPDEIAHRLFELDEEWDIERALETMASSFSLGGLLLATFGSRRWLMLPLVVQSFFLQHALQGWCPPLPLLRRLGVRTAREIEDERRALREILAGANVHQRPS